jgi:hypothetical protein
VLARDALASNTAVDTIGAAAIGSSYGATWRPPEGIRAQLTVPAR